jgi:hypothetical protein
MKKVCCFLGLSAILVAGFSTRMSAQAKVKDTASASSKRVGKSDSKDQLQGSGLMGYITSSAPQPASGYGAGIGFYVAVYPILPQPIDNFQIGLASTWIVPKNADNTTEPLCPRVRMQEIIGRMGVNQPSVMFFRLLKVAWECGAALSSVPDINTQVSNSWCA